MKNILILLLIHLSLSSCAFESEMPGYRFSNFENTKAWDLAKAVKDNSAERVKKILNSKKVNVDFKDPQFHETLLSLAVVNQKNNAIIELLKAGADPNELVGEQDETPFINAIRFNENCDLFYVQTLLKYGANPNLEIHNPKMGYHFTNSFPLLVAINNLDNNGNSCLNLVKLLVNKGANMNSCYAQDYAEICEGVITESLTANNFEALKYFVIEKNIKIPDTVFIYGGIDKSTQKVYGLSEALKSEHFISEDFEDELGSHKFTKERKIRDEILNYLDKNKK